MVYQVHGEGGLPPKLLLTEFASNVLIGLLAAFVLANITGSLVLRAMMAGVIALIGSTDIYGSYWNWYKFSTDYTLAQITIQLVGFLLMGVVIAAIDKKQ